MTHLYPCLEKDCWRLVVGLFEIHRSIMGEGFVQSLRLIQEVAPFERLLFPSGTKCGSWTIPQEWIVNNASVTDATGKKVLDFAKDPSCLWHYSVPFSGMVSRQELLEHLYSKPDSPNLVPIGASLYRSNWGFSMADAEMKRLPEGKYHVNIETTFKHGEMAIGQLHLPGRTKKEIIIDAVLGCPALANNLTGVAVAVYLAKLLSSLSERHFTYRILLTPETIGPIALHFLTEVLSANIVGGYCLVNLGDSASFHYKKSRPGTTLADKAMFHVLKSFESSFIRDFDVRTGSCGNEKAYNSLGIAVPVGSFHRSPLGSYPEYDTAQDDLSFISSERMFASLKTIWSAILAIERSRVYKHTFEGEPFLTGYGMGPKIASEEDRLAYDYLMGYSAGDLTLVEIADKAGISVTCFDEAVGHMLECGLLQEVQL